MPLWWLLTPRKEEQAWNKKGCQMTLFLFLSYSGINVLFHRKWKGYTLALFFFFFWKKSILDLSSCSAKTIRNLENSTSIRVDLVSLQTRKPKWSPRSFSKLPKSHRWKILDQTADALTLVKSGSAICAGHQLTNLAHIFRAAKVSFGTSLWNTQGHQGSPGICSVMNRKRGKKPCREEKKA